MRKLRLVDAIHGWVAIMSLVGLATLVRTLSKALDYWVGSDGVDLIGVPIMLWGIIAAGSVLLGACTGKYRFLSTENQNKLWIEAFYRNKRD